MPKTMPTRSQTHGLGRFSKSGQNLPFCEGKKSSDSLAGICMKQAPGGGAGEPVPAVLLGATTQPPYLRFMRAHHPPSPPYFLATLKKTILNGNFLRKLHQSQAMPKDVIH